MVSYQKRLRNKLEDLRTMELKTKSKRPGMDCSIDVYFDRTKGFSKYINDPDTYKMVLVRTGSFVVEEDGEYRVVTAPASLALNERAVFNVTSESEVETITIYFKPTFIREEFTYEAINSGKYEKFLSAVKDGDKMAALDRFLVALEGDAEFDKSFSDSSICQDALLLLEFHWHRRNIIYYSLTTQELQAALRLFMSVRYDLEEQPDNFWILRTRYFIISMLFMATADFYRDYRQDELYKDPLVVKVSKYLWDHLEEDITLSKILKKFSVNKNTLNDAFNNEMNMSCMAYLEMLRVNLAKKHLQFDDESVSEISQMCGYTDTNYFSKVFKKHTGQTPSEYRKQMKGLC